MVKRTKAEPAADDAFDYSTADAEQAMQRAIELVLEVRDFEVSPLARKVMIYERTLGLAVAPVLLRRAVTRLWHRRRPSSSNQ